MTRTVRRLSTRQARASSRVTTNRCLCATVATARRYSTSRSSYRRARQKKGFGSTTHSQRSVTSGNHRGVWEGASPTGLRPSFLPLFTRVRGIGILRTSSFGDSRKFEKKVGKILQLSDTPTPLTGVCCTRYVARRTPREGQDCYRPSL